MNRKGKIAAILAIWIFAFAFHIRYFPNLEGSPIPGTWGVNVDFARYHLVKTGVPGGLQNPQSDIAGWMNNQTYDLGSYVLAILNIVTGTTGLISGLYFLDAILLFPIIILPLVGVGIYVKRTSNSAITPNGQDILLLLTLALFLSPTYVLQSRIGYHPAFFARATLIILFFSFISYADLSPRKFLFIAILPLLALAPNLYHTWTYFFVFLLVSVTTLENTVGRLVATRVQSIPFTMVLVFGVLFGVSAIWWNGRLFEVSHMIAQILGEGPGAESYFDSAESSLVETNISSIFNNLTVRRFSVIAGMIATATLVLSFFVSRVHSMQRLKKALADPVERLILFSLPMFLGIAGLLLVYGGPGAMIGRTKYVGIFWAFFIVAAELGSRWERPAHQWITIALVGIIITTSLAGVLLSPRTTSVDTLERQETLVFAGTYVDSETTVISDAGLAPPLAYYGHENFVTIRVVYPEWEALTRAIYFDNSSQDAIEAMDAVAEQSSTKPGSDRVLIVSARMKRTGINLWSFETKPIPQYPPKSVDTSTEMMKVYTTNETIIYRND